MCRVHVTLSSLNDRLCGKAKDLLAAADADVRLLKVTGLALPADVSWLGMDEVTLCITGETSHERFRIE